MSEWKEYKINEIGKVVTGATPSSKNPEDFGNDTMFVTPSDYKSYTTYIRKTDRYLSEIGREKLKNRILPTASVMVTCIGSDMGKVALNPEEVITNQQINSIIPNHTVNNYFLYYKLKDEYDTLRMYGGEGTAVPIVNKSTFENIELLLPTLSEQKRIAEILSSLDDKIDLLHKQNETLEQLAETLFRQWFVEPIKRIVNEVDEIEGFSNDKFSKWISETVGGEWGKENAEDDFNKVVYCIRGTDIADLKTGLPMKTPLRFIKENKFKNIEPNEGDLIIEISGGTENQSTGRVCYINQDIKDLFEYPIIFSNFCRMIRVKKPEYSFFLYCYIQYLYNQDEFFNLENGSSGIKNLDYKALIFEIEYPMPNEKLVIDFHNQVKVLFKKVNQNKTQILTLTALRDTLLPKLMSGEIRVNLAEA